MWHALEMAAAVISLILDVLFWWRFFLSLLASAVLAVLVHRLASGPDLNGGLTIAILFAGAAGGAVWQYKADEGEGPWQG